MRFAVRKRRHPPAVIIVSLIDILIVLLIFLMVSTTFKDAPALRITLPESHQADPRPGVSENPPIIVTITTNAPALYLGKLPITFDQLEKELQTRAHDNPNATLTIRADTLAPYGTVVKVIEAGQAAQVHQIKTFVRSAMQPP